MSKTLIDLYKEQVFVTQAQPQVSVCMVTYNHSGLIAQAIESALAQETTFEYEIVIGEDGSTDGTRSIVEDYAGRFPDKIRAFLHPKNLGPQKLGLQGRNNFVSTYHACKGRYIAFLDGDDYWTDSKKLQKQVDFLEAHPECVLSSHPAEILYSNGRKRWWPSMIGASSKQIRTLEDILPIFNREENLELPTPCMMIRGGLIQKFPKWFYEVFNHEIALQWLAACHGKIGFLSECMAVSRKHGGGLSRLYETDPDFCWEKFLKLHLSIDRHLGYQYHSIIKDEIAQEWRYRFSASKRKGKYGKAIWALIQYALTLITPKFRQKFIYSVSR